MNSGITASTSLIGFGLARPMDPFEVKKGPWIEGPTSNQTQTASGPEQTGWGEKAD